MEADDGSRVRKVAAVAGHLTPSVDGRCKNEFFTFLSDGRGRRESLPTFREQVEDIFGLKLCDLGREGRQRAASFNAIYRTVSATLANIRIPGLEGRLEMRLQLMQRRLFVGGAASHSPCDMCHDRDNPPRAKSHKMAAVSARRALC